MCFVVSALCIDIVGSSCYKEERNVCSFQTQDLTLHCLALLVLHKWNFNICLSDLISFHTMLYITSLAMYKSFAKHTSDFSQFRKKMQVVGSDTTCNFNSLIYIKGNKMFFLLCEAQIDGTFPCWTISLNLCMLNYCVQCNTDTSEGIQCKLLSSLPISRKSNFRNVATVSSDSEIIIQSSESLKYLQGASSLMKAFNFLILLDFKLILMFYICTLFFQTLA